MTTRAQKVRLGIFMLLALLLLLGGVATLAGLKLWNPKDRYSVRFAESVSGLEAGSTVKMKGVRVGQVEKIKIDAKDVSTVVVTLALDPKTPVKTDTRAVMTAIGITGLKFIELTGGSAQAPRLKPNTRESVIPPAASALQSLTGKAEHIAKKMELVLNNLVPLTDASNRARVRQLLDNANQMLRNFADVADEGSRKRIQRILANVDRMTITLDRAARQLSKLTAANSQRLSSTLAAAESAARSLDRATRKFRPQATLNEISAAARAMKKRIEDPALTSAVASMNKAAVKISVTTGDMQKLVRRRDRQLERILSNLDSASSNLKSFARSIKERPSLLLRGQTRKEREVP